MKWLNIEQNSEVWEAARLGKITASQFGSIISDGDTATGYALQLALERINKKPSVNRVKTAHMDRGHRQESEAIALYEAQYFTDVRGGGFFDCGYYGDSPDGLVGVTGTVEVKSVIAKVHYATFLRGSHDPAYHWQIVGHIDCSDRDWCDFVSYCADFPEGKQIIVYRIEREDVMRDIEILSERRERFNESVERIRQQIMEI